MTIDVKGKSEEDIIREAVFHTYNIKNDDLMLRSNPADFEKLRGNYPLRREFPSYTVSFKGVSDGEKKILERIGFNIAGNAGK
jgi:erythronate-4-phosphate dehydrogenase